MTIKAQTNSVVTGTGGSGQAIDRRSMVSGLVLVCGDSPVATSIAGMTVEGTEWRFETTDDLCRNSDGIDQTISMAPTNRLIVALCRGEHSKSEFLSRSRKAGIETFGTQIVEIPAATDSDANKAASVTTVRGAIARSEAFGSADAGNIKTAFSGAGGKISRRALFTIPPIEYRSVPTINRSACIAGSGCTQCEKSCPHSAIKNVAGTVQVDTSACKSCGLCVAACPQRAVEFPSFSPVEIESQVEAVLSESDGSSKNIAFACSKSENMPIDDWQIVPVACAAMVPAAALLSTVSAGARSVGILRCVEECSQQSSREISGRIDYAKNVLERAGVNSNRIVNLAPSILGTENRSPAVSEPPGVGSHSVEIFGRTAASNSVLALNEMSPNGIEAFTHAYSPIGVPVVSSTACTMCGTCSAVCPSGALTQTTSENVVELTLDAAKCIACSECVESCPESANGAIELDLRTDVSALTVGPVRINSDQAIACANCNTQFTSQLTLNRLEVLLGEDYSHDLYGTLCPECRTLA